MQNPRKKEDRTLLMNFLISEREREQLKKVAKKRGQTMSSFIRSAIASAQQ